MGAFDRRRKSQMNICREALPVGSLGLAMMDSQLLRDLPDESLAPVPKMRPVHLAACQTWDLVV
jgi:hypothetical protein